VKTLLLATVMMALGYSPLVAQDVDKGERAYNAGDYAKALTEWLPLAERGNASAQSNLGVMYHNGEGLKQDTARAFLLYSLAAKQGHAGAQSNLGNRYSRGQGVQQDHAKALRWWRLAAVQGNPKAQYNLAVMYALGKIVVQDYATAHMWFNISSNNGHKTAAKGRDNAAARMSFEEISVARQRAKDCISSKYQNCGF